MAIKKMYLFGIISATILMAVDLIYFMMKKDFNLFLFLAGLSMAILCLPFIMGIVIEGRKDEEMNEMFLEFSRNLAESVSTGTPISKSIINIRKKNYGVLNPYLVKLANQIELGVSVDVALQNFSSDVNSSVIKRAVALIREAEKAGGE